MAYKQRGASKPRCRRRGSSCCQGWMGKPIGWPPSKMGRISSCRTVPPPGKSCLSSGAARKWGDMRGAGLRESIGPVGAADQTIGNGPGFGNVDLRVSKKFNLGNIKKKDERSPDLEFRLDSFNVFNHVNARSFIGTLSSPFFGRANSAYPARELQASVRFSF